MQNKSYISGSLNRKSDFHIEYKPASTGTLDIKIYSKTMNLHGSKLKAIATSTISFFNIKHGIFLITDNGGQYFVLQARLEAAIKSANSKIGKSISSVLDVSEEESLRIQLSDGHIDSNVDKIHLDGIKLLESNPKFQYEIIEEERTKKKKKNDKSNIKNVSSPAYLT